MNDVWSMKSINAETHDLRENPSNAKEKNHGHQSATISLSQEFGLHACGGLQENQVSTAQASGDGPPLRSVRSPANILKWIWNNSNSDNNGC